MSGKLKIFLKFVINYIKYKPEYKDKCYWNGRNVAPIRTKWFHNSIWRRELG